MGGNVHVLRWPCSSLYPCTFIITLRPSLALGWSRARFQQYRVNPPILDIQTWKARLQRRCRDPLVAPSCVSGLAPGSMAMLPRVVAAIL